MKRKPPSRRETLKAAAASAAIGCTPKGIGSSDSGRVRPGAVDHIVVVMMENRSFDHWYGALSLEEGKAVDGLQPEHRNTNAAGVEVGPFPSVEPCLHDPPHGYTSTLRQIADGTMGGFCSEYAARIGGEGNGVMAYQRRSDIPISFAMADHYALCDRYFSSIPGPTWPNRLFAHLATSEGYRQNAWPQTTMGFTAPSIWEGLEAAGHDWRYYYGDLPFMALLKDHFRADRCRLIERFFDDCQNGSLPAVTWVDPSFAYNDNHPPHHPARGEVFIGAIHEALVSSPIWERCLIVLTYDEHGGFYDHVPPPTTDDDLAEDGFGQLGVRVPTVVMGPWVKQGVDSTVYDHTSWIRYAAERFGVPLWNRRLEAANSLAGALDEERMERGDPLPALDLPAFDLPPEALDEACDYATKGPPPHLIRQARWLEEHGIPVRFHEPGRMESILLPFLRRRGLIG
jgi:phospholipase C